MAQITELPEEVVVMIVRRLDFWSQCSMYNSCKFFRNILSLHGIVLECHMSLNSVATVNTMRLDFFKAISNHLRVLNMCGVPDLSKTKVLPAFKKLKRLKVLDISFTNLTMTDLIAIHNVCPTLKDITVDFKFSQTAVQIAEDTLQQSQKLFEHFENVHFVGSLNNLLSSMVVLQILEKSKLDTLKFSVVDVDNMHTTMVTNKVTDCQMPHFSHFAAFLLINWRSRCISDDFSNFPVISKIELDNYEFCVIYSLNRQRHTASVYATPLLTRFFKEQFNISTKCMSDYMMDIKGNVAFMVWNRATTSFDDIFFQKLYTRVKTCFPFYHESCSAVSCPQNYDWIYTNPKANEIINVDAGQQRKKRKTSMPNVMLDYDNLLKDISKAQLSITFLPNVIVSASLPCNGQYFSKITFLSLFGAVRYSADFFSNLFVWCHNLVTLSVEFLSFAASRYSYDILHAIKASKSIKNLRLTDKGMDLKQFFDSLSKCQTLENIHLMDPKQWDHCQIADPTLLVEGCANLYSVFVEGLFAETAIIKQLQMFNKVKISCSRPHLRVVINQSSHITNSYGYDPFVDVFKLNAIKPI